MPECFPEQLWNRRCGADDPGGGQATDRARRGGPGGRAEQVLRAQADLGQQSAPASAAWIGWPPWLADTRASCSGASGRPWRRDTVAWKGLAADRKKKRVPWSLAGAEHHGAVGVHRRHA